VRAEIERLKAKRLERIDVTADMVVQRLRQLAFYDVRRFYDERGNLLPVHQLDDDIAPAVAGITVQPARKKGRRIIAEKTKGLKLVNQQVSLELLGRHLGMFKDHLVIEKDEFEGKTPEELRYYASHNGQWPTSSSGSTGTGVSAETGEGGKTGE
jgi:phage terminase small subunit